MDDMKDLTKYLAEFPTGPISDTSRLLPLLEACWDDFVGSDAEGMTSTQLYRLDTAIWLPPLLYLAVERDDCASYEFKRWERMMWWLNMDAKRATCQLERHVQLRPHAEVRVDVGRPARRVVRMILEHQADEWLQWNQDGSVRVCVGKILPEGLAVQQTIAARRKRFRRAVRDRLARVGWQQVGLHVYAPSAGSTHMRANLIPKCASHCDRTE